MERLELGADDDVLVGNSRLTILFNADQFWLQYAYTLRKTKTTTPVTETYSQIGNVTRAIRRCIANRPVSEKKNVVSTIGSARTERITWLAKMERYSVRTGPWPGKIVSPCSVWFTM